MADEIKQQDEDYIEIKIPSQEPPRQEAAAEKAQVKEPAEKPKPITPKKKAVKSAPAKKAAAKKQPIKSAPAKKPAERSAGAGNWLWAVLLILGVVVIVVVIYLSLRGAPKDDGEELRVAALVNGMPIYTSELNDIYDNLPENMKETNTKEDVLDQLIEQEVLAQAAAEAGVEATDEDVAAYIHELMVYFGVNETEFASLVELQGITMDEFVESARNQIAVTKFVNETVLSNIVVTEEEIQQRYIADEEYLTIPQTATVRHILISPGENETLEETLAKAEEVKAMIADDFSNFCDLVTEYSADPGSVASCGEYSVAQDGSYVPEFEEAAFALDINETDIVQTAYGYHIIWKVRYADAGIRPLEEVRDQVEEYVRQEKASLAVRQFISELRDQATIEKYPIDGAPLVPEQTAPATVEQEVEQEESAKVEVEKSKPVREGDFGKCLADAGAVLYGVDWPSATDVVEQIELLGEAADQVTYVDCDPDNGQVPAACEGMSAYPTWIIGSGDDAQVLTGKQSLNALSQKTGCAQ